MLFMLHVIIAALFLCVVLVMIVATYPPAYAYAGGVFMYRRNQLWGCTAFAFGLGLLIGIWIEGGFWAHCFGFALLGVGCSFFRRK